MTENKANLPFPELINCACNGEMCAKTGCFFANLLERLNPDDYPGQKLAEAKEKIFQMASNGTCMISAELRSRFK